MSTSESISIDPVDAPRPEMPEMRSHGPMRPWWRLARALARTIFILAFKGRVIGAANVPREGAVLLVSTHQSFFDPVLASLAFDRECNFMARESLFNNSVLRRLICSLNAFPVRRNSADLRAIKETLRRLKKGAMVLVFPEGTRTTTGRIGSLQPGVAAIARQAKVTVVPTLIEGAFNVWPRDAKWPRLSRIVVRYAPAISPVQVAAMSKEELIQRIDRTLRDMQEQVRSVYPFQPFRDGREE
jgi:1-acyl-sn-glycerol-3-phosphate acyltransferase